MFMLVAQYPGGSGKGARVKRSRILGRKFQLNSWKKQICAWPVHSLTFKRNHFETWWHFVQNTQSETSNRDLHPWVRQRASPTPRAQDCGHSCNVPDCLLPELSQSYVSKMASEVLRGCIIQLALPRGVGILASCLSRGKWKEQRSKWVWISFTRHVYILLRRRS